MSLQVLNVENRHAAAGPLSDFVANIVEERGNLETLLTEPRVVGERQSEVARADDRDSQFAVQAKDLPQMPAQVADVIADAADAEFAEIREVLADLGGVEVKALGEPLGRDGLHAGGLELVQAPQVHREPVCRELRDLFEVLF